MYLDSIIDYLDRGNYVTGLEKAADARVLADAPNMFPGVATSLLSFDAAFMAGRLLTADGEFSDAAGLHAKADKLPLIQKVVIYQLLRKYYIENGDQPSAKSVRQSLLEIVPHIDLS